MASSAALFRRVHVRLGLLVVSAAFAAHPAPAQSVPATQAPSAAPAQQKVNDLHPNTARPPWVGAPVQNPDRPNYSPPTWFPYGPLGPALPYSYPSGVACAGPHAFYGVPPWSGDRRAIVNAYRTARDEQRRDEARYFNEQDMNRRKERLLSTHAEALAAGLERLRSGDHAQAVVALTLAAELDQGDPACRMHLAQARLALRQYDEAGRVLRRALQLQPKLVYADLHLERYFDTPVGELAKRYRIAPVAQLV